MTLDQLDHIAVMAAPLGLAAVVGGVAWAAKTLVYRHCDNYNSTAAEKEYQALEAAPADEPDLVQAR